MAVFPSYAFKRVTETQFQMLNIGGGGYSIGLSVADDGSGNMRMLLRNDEPGVWLWKSDSPTAWRNVTTTPGTSFTSLGSFGSPYEAVFVKSQGPGQKPWAYMVNNTAVSLISSNGRAQTRMAVWKSTDGAETWTKTNLVTVSGYNHINKFAGPHIAGDPNNPAICYVMALPGVVYVTYNGGTTWHRVEALLGALPSATSTQNVSAGNQTITLDAVPAAVENDWAVYNATHELTVGTNSGNDVVIGVNAGAKTVTVPVLEPIDGSSAGNSVRIGDTIYFGLAAGVAIDGASGTVANPGIGLGDPGATGVASKIIYFGWLKGASSLWWTQNGNPESAAAMPSGGPSELGASGAICGKMHLSTDATLTGGGCNVLYVTDNDTRGWRFVSTPPTGSGLAANTWTHLPVTQGSSPCCFAPDPFVAGRVAAISSRQLVNNVFTDYGETSVSGNTGVLTAAGQGGADAPWLATCADIFGSDAAWDLNVQNKLWSLSGLGVWYSTIPTAAGGFTQTITTASKGMDSLIPCKVVKAPSPNGRILLACEDRQLFSLADENTPPSTYYFNVGVGGGVGNGFDITYSDSDPTVCWGSLFNVVRSTDSGQNWTQVSNVGQCSIASTTALNAVLVPPNGTGLVQYTTDGGSNWSNSTYGGNTMTGWGGQAFSNFYHLTTDGNGNYFYYDYNPNDPPSSKFLVKSTDGGATFTQIMSTNLAATFYPTGGSAMGGGGCLRVVPGHPTHLYYAPGEEGGAGFNPSRPLLRSTNGGVNWEAVSSVYWAVSVSFGKGNGSYPACYVAGQLVSNGTFGIYRCDDITAVSPVWVHLSKLTDVTSDAVRGGICADPEVYGKIYGGTSGSGAWVGRLA